jgi:hypothetical protein
MLKQFVRQRTQTVHHFEISASHRSDVPANSSAATLPVEPGTVYLEVRMKEMFLRDQRILHRQFIPLGLFTCGLIFNGAWQEVPFIVQPGQVGKNIP